MSPAHTHHYVSGRCIHCGYTDAVGPAQTLVSQHARRDIARAERVESERDRYFDALRMLRRRCEASVTGMISITAVLHVVDGALAGTSDDLKPSG